MASENQGLARLGAPDRETWLTTLGGVFTRVVLFAIEGTSAKVTGVRGLSDLLIGTTTSLTEQTPLRWAIEAASPIVGAGRSPSGELMARMLKLAAPRAFAVVPLVYGKKLAGLAYGDCGNQALPLASVSEVFAACEKLLNPKHKDKSALPDKQSIRSTARRDSRDLRKPRPRATRGHDVQVLMLTEIIEEQTPAKPPPPPRDTVLDPIGVKPSREAETRVLASPPRERGFRRGRRRPTKPITRELFNLQEALSERPTRDVAPRRAASRPPNTPEEPRRPAQPHAADARSEPSRPPSLDRNAQHEPSRAAAFAADAQQESSRPPSLDRNAQHEPSRAAAFAADAQHESSRPPSLDGDAQHEPSRSASLDKDAPPQQPRHPPPSLLAKTPPTIEPRGTATEPYLNPFPAADRAAASADLHDASVIEAVPGARSGPNPWLVFAVTLAVCLAGIAVLAPPTSHGVEERVVTIPSGASASAIGAALADAELVRSATAFTVLGGLTRTRGLRAGSYRVTTGSWPWTVAAQLRAGQETLLHVVIPEGASLTEIGKRMAASGIADEAAFTAAVDAPQLLSKYGIVALDAQGWLAPGSYAMARGIGAVDAMGVMIERFKAQLATLPETAGLSAEALNQVLVLGSLVEKEAKDKTEARRIAGLFHNRLKLGMRLESRASVLYILGEEKRELTLADVRQPSPYNTYLNAGLPPGPIATPSLDALRAALHPEEHGYFYMADRNDGAGAHVFSVTYEEHLKAQRENR